MGEEPQQRKHRLWAANLLAPHRRTARAQGQHKDRHRRFALAKRPDTSLWPSWEIYPDSPWNYGLVLDDKDPAASFNMVKRNWPASDFPYTLDEVPIMLTAKGRKIPEWTIDRYGLVALLQDSPVLSDQPVETVTLVPMGTARLRISAFPTIGPPTISHRWNSPANSQSAGL